VLQAGSLLLTFVGAGLYLRGFYAYFKAVRWLRAGQQVDVRRRYRSSAIAALLQEPELQVRRVEFLMGLVGPILFAVGGIAFNALQ
jgi:hypothetical protein